MSGVMRISPEETLQKVSSGQALLVCSYADDAKFAQYHLEGAIPLSRLQGQIETLSRDREIIFYCN